MQGGFASGDVSGKRAREPGAAIPELVEGEREAECTVKRGSTNTDIGMMGSKKKPDKAVTNLACESSTGEPADLKRIIAPAEEAQAPDA